MLSCTSFPETEDSATLRSDMSTVSGFRRQCVMRCLFHCLLGSQSAIPRGPGQSPRKSGSLRYRIAADKRPSDSIGNICQQCLTGCITSELAMKLILCYMACFHCHSHAMVRICLPDWAKQSVFLHQTAYLLDVHDNRRIQMQQTHIDASSTFLVATELIGLFYQCKIPTV